MAWEGSTRRSRLPNDWYTRIRPRILHRDGHQCTARDHTGKRCTEPATDVDHIIPGDDHRDDNLTALCTWHHLRKTAAEANRARKRYTNRRPREPHPGITP